MASVSDVEAFFETRAIKVAFTDNDHNLFFVDFSEQPPTVHPIAEATRCSNLAMSPDGNWIAFQTGGLSDGQNHVESTAWIVETREDATPVQISATDSGYTPRFLQGADVLTVVWATCGAHPTPDKYAWDGCGAMMKRTCEGGVPGPVDTLFAGGCYFGGTSYSGLYLSSAEYRKNGFIKEIASPIDEDPEAVHNMTCTKSGEDTTFALQACNPSTSQSRNYQNAFMFLDFGFFPENDGLTNCNPDFGSWGFHQILFILNDTGKILKRYYVRTVDADVDTGLPCSNEWANSEWTNHPYYGVACEYIVRKWPHPTIPILEPSKKMEHITAINLKDSAALRLVSTVDTLQSNHKGFYFGALYVPVPDGFQEECWLDDSCASSSRSPIFNTISMSHISMRGAHLVSRDLMKKVVLYRADGTAVYCRKSINSRSIVLQHANFPAGIYVIAVQFVHDGTITMPVVGFQPDR
ncbi:MAG: hypothetical protein GF350_02370 [Chitinivibrionales bacterium]|nr:hypothetical protein [Chitinivibrionales bacterium]